MPQARPLLSIIAIDGNKFNAVNTLDRNFTRGKLNARMTQVEEGIDRYRGHRNG